MKSYKTYSTVTTAKQIVLTDLPFGSGEKVEVVVRAANGKRSERIRRLRKLFKETQSLPQVRVLAEDDIIREIDDYRTGK